MEVSLAPEVEARLARIASEAGKPASQVVEELVTTYVDHDEWFKSEVLLRAKNALLRMTAGNSRFLDCA